MVRNSILVAMVVVVCWVGEITSEPFTFKMDDLQKELGYFGECKGKKINYPSNSITKGFQNVPGCISALSFPIPGSAYAGVELSKPCVALCVAEQMGIIDKTSRLYQWDVAVKPLYDTVNATDASQRNEKEIIDIQANALKRCGTTGPNGPPKFLLKEKCDEAHKFDDCIRMAAVTDCQNTAAPPTTGAGAAPAK